MDHDQEKKTIDCFRNRLKQLIRVAPVLDVLHFLSDEQKELIKAKLQNEGEKKAADLLLQEIISKTYPEGWFRELITALEMVGCKQAANYMENNPPSPSLEAENDTYIRLIDLLKLSLINMKTRDVCHSCYERNILTAEDRETILAVTEQHGNMAGARALLSQLPKNEFGWFSQFLDALEKTEHIRLVQELRGEPDEPSESSADVDKPQSLKDESELATQTDTKMGEEILDNPAPRSLSPPPSLAIGSSAEAAALDRSMDSSSFLSCMDSSAELSIGGTEILDNPAPRSLSPPPSLAIGSSAEAAALDRSMDSSSFLSCMDSSAELSIGGTGWPTSDTHSLHPI
ncbi:hypothetical protein PGIGA_G00217330 [Pangasianodon gigas]|uniref:Uncharacterized protein n=1 Tax=Pangasianodon gigas TaxID=30993 RepID=A0ACC5WHU0_PANGG|nr:hypothetical protein [Pangasianodon gigas]